MLGPNGLRARLDEGEVLIGCWSHLASPIAAEVVALAGYDFLIIDHEHGPGHYLDATAILQAVSGTGVGGLIRVPWNDTVHLKRALDTGVDGVIVPYVSTEEEARRAVDACFYPPKGTRGMAHVLCRASHYGLKMEEYAETLERNLSVVVMIETPQGVANLPAIAALDGLHMIFIGPFDLSTSLGIAGEFDNPRFRNLLLEAEAAVKESGKVLGSIATRVDDVQALRERGYRFIASTSDVLLLRDAALGDLRTARVRR